MARLFFPLEMILVAGLSYATVIHEPPSQSIIQAGIGATVNSNRGSIAVEDGPSDGKVHFLDNAKVILTVSQFKAGATLVLRNGSHSRLGLVNTMTKVSASIWPGRLDEWYPTGGEV